MALSTQYDPIFRRHAGRLPVAYLRALAAKESGFNPQAAASSSENAARGLLQIVGVARVDYNQRHGTNYSSQDLFDPNINVAIGADLLQRIVSYLGRHPSKNLHEDWHNPEFVKLLTAGWNAGFSDSGGVGRVASYLEAQRAAVTHDAVYDSAAAAGAVSALQNPARAAWQRGVADLYYQQPDRFDTGGRFVTLLMVVLAGWGTYQVLRS